MLRYLDELTYQYKGYNVRILTDRRHPDNEFWTASAWLPDDPLPHRACVYGNDMTEGVSQRTVEEYLDELNGQSPAPLPYLRY